MFRVRIRWCIQLLLLVVVVAGSDTIVQAGGGGGGGGGECSTTTSTEDANVCPPRASSSSETISYVLLAVSGTLEEGFELRPNMDYRPNNDDENTGRVNATFLGKALVRGYKSFLDIKNPTWREYKDDVGVLKTVNPALVPTGCNEHANRYSIYAVDARQAMNALAGEPRFLSIAPDMGLTDLTAADDLTYPDIKKLARTYALNSTLSGLVSSSSQNNDGHGVNLDRIAFLTVTSTWFKSTFVANGILREDEDGIITDYPESTAIWSYEILNKNQKQNGGGGTVVQHEQYPQGCGSNPNGGQVTNVNSAMDYNICIDAAIRRQEAQYTTMGQVEKGDRGGRGDLLLVGDHAAYEFCADSTATSSSSSRSGGEKACYKCQSLARYGTDKYTARFNKVLTACQLEELMVSAGVVNEETGRPKFPLQGCSL